MMDQAGSGLALFQCHAERLQRQIIFQGAVQRPANHPTRKRIDDYRQIYKLGFQTNVGDVGDPEPVNPAQFHLALQVRIYLTVVVGIRGHHELSFPNAQQVILTHDPPHAVRPHLPALPFQFGCDPGPTVAGPLQCSPLDGVTQVHVPIPSSALSLIQPVEAGAAHAAQLHHALYRQSPLRLDFLFDLPADRGFPLSACSIRCSSMRCKQPFKKSISRACWPTFRSNSAICPSDQRCFPLPGNALPGPCRNSRRQRCNTFGFTSNARATSAIETPCSSRRTAASLNSFVNCLRDNPMTPELCTE